MQDSVSRTVYHSSAVHDELFWSCVLLLEVKGSVQQGSFQKWIITDRRCPFHTHSALSALVRVERKRFDAQALNETNLSHSVRHVHGLQGTGREQDVCNDPQQCGLHLFEARAVWRPRHVPKFRRDRTLCGLLPPPEFESKLGSQQRHVQRSADYGSARSV